MADLVHWFAFKVLEFEIYYSQRLSVGFLYISWFPGAVVIDIRDIETTVIFNQVDHWFSDVEPPRKLGLWDTSTKTITSLRRLRHIPAAGWKMEQHEITHLSTGGVTVGR